MLAPLLAENSQTPLPWRVRWRLFRNRVLASRQFQTIVARVPLIHLIARHRARQAFDLVAGFTYSQVLLAALEAELLDLLAEGPQDLAAIADRSRLSRAAASRLIGAMAALNLAEEVGPGQWMLGRHGAVIQADAGICAMIRHHRLLYSDLADPLALLRADRAKPTALSSFWAYGTPDEARTTAYSELMAASQAMISREVLGAYDFSRHRAVLDVGGGNGAFARALAERHRRLQLGIFDLPEVLRGSAAIHACERSAIHPGDFFRDALPTGYDCITLVRILHDHDDNRALSLLGAVRRALPAGGRLLIAEPMAGTRGADGLQPYFGFYLWAMGAGMLRSAAQIGHLLEKAGFRRWIACHTAQPLVASVVVAYA